VLPFLSSFSTTQQLDDFQPDVIHIATPSPMGHFALRYANKKNIPVISIYHTHFLSYVAYYLKSTPFLIEPTVNRIAKRSKYFYDNCDLVYVPTQEMVDYLAGYDHETTHMKIWQRGIDQQLFSPTKKDKPRLQKITGNDKPIILFVSRLVWEKNLDTLIRFYQLNEAKNRPYNLLIAGEGVAQATLQEQMPNAYFLGNQSHTDLAFYYASADVFLFTSITETYGNVVVEAMASGLPCVIANGGGSKSFIQHGVNGFLCEPNHPQDYFNHITQLLQQPRLYEQFQAESLALVAPLNWDSLVAQYLEDLQLLQGQRQAVAA
ncbi:MAG: glycosyltransferase, partial [Bacteroidota bacterium]